MVSSTLYRVCQLLTGFGKLIFLLDDVGAHVTYARRELHDKPTSRYATSSSLILYKVIPDAINSRFTCVQQRWSEV